MPRKNFVQDPNLPYHIISRCINRDWFAQEMPLVWKIVTRHLFFVNHAFNLRIHGFVLMNNHFHMIIRAPDGNLSEAMAYFLRETSRDLTRLSNRINQTFGGRFRRSLISSPHYYSHAYKYLYRNPVEAGLCERVEDYEYSSLQGLLGKRWLDVPISEDENWANFASREETLEWLNASPKKEHWEEVRKALRRSEFKLAPVNQRKSSLEDDAL
ncbi:transposase [Bdellovibrio sp. HCB2-146]|uniref:transposase n=1 Tax=Bdellovibrio sp. HCB2-146 TaxID=3394362 RepID=UPI0039BCA129